MKRLMLCGLVPMMVSCLAPPDYVRVDVRFTPVEQTMIRQAAGDWQIATGERIDLVFGEHVDADKTSRTHNMLRTTSRDPTVHDDIVTVENNATGTGTFVANGTYVATPLFGNKLIVIVVDAIANAGIDIPYDELFTMTVRHELGHYLGLAHNFESKTAIMRPSVSRGQTLSSCITEEDTTAYCTIHEADGCRQDQMHGCTVTEPADAAQAIITLQ